MPALLDAWQTAWSALDAQPEPALFDQLLAAYAEPHRRYHTQQHLQECLNHLQGAWGLAERPGEVALALQGANLDLPAGHVEEGATELVVREDGWALYGFLDEAERRFFQRLISVSGVGPKIGIALLSHLGVERGARALREKNIALLSSVNGIGRKTAERLALELGEKVEDFTEAPAGAVPAGAEAALKALERLGYGVPEADRAIRQALAGNGTETETETLVRRALQILTTG